MELRTKIPDDRVANAAVAALVEHCAPGATDRHVDPVESDIVCIVDVKKCATVHRQTRQRRVCLLLPLFAWRLRVHWRPYQQE